MEEEDDDDEIIIESKRSDDPACNLHALADVGICLDDETDGDNNNVYRKRFTMESFLNASNENKDAGVVDEREHIKSDQEVIDEDEVKCTHKGDVKTCNIDCNMDALFRSENNIESNNVELCVSNDGLDGFSNRSTDLYHSTDSIQYHSAEYDQPAVDVTENHSLFNIGVEISLNDNNTSGNFDNDVSSSSEIVNCKGNTNNEETGHVVCNGETLDSAVTVTTICEALLQENGDNSYKVSELSIENSDSAVMNTFNISSSEYDATVTTTLEVSSSGMDTIGEPCSTPDDKNSIMKTFEISSPMYDATITATVADITSPGANGIADSNHIDISSHDLDGSIKTYTKDHDGKTEINFQVSSVVPSHDDYIDTISDITPASISSHDSVSIERDLSVETHDDAIISPRSESSIQKSYDHSSCDSNTDLVNSFNENDSSEMMFLVSAESNSEVENNSEQVETYIQDTYSISSEHDGTQILSESNGTTYYEDVDNVMSEVSPFDIDRCLERDGIPEANPPTGVSDTLSTSFETDSLHEDVLYESDVTCTNNSNMNVVVGNTNHFIGIDVQEPDIIIHNTSVLSEGIDNVVSEVSPCDIDISLERDDISETSPATGVCGTPTSFETDSLHEDVLYESDVTCANISNMNIVAGNSDHFDVDVQEPDIITHHTSHVISEPDGENMLNISGAYYDADIEESSNITQIEILSQDRCTSADTNITCDEIICDNTNNNLSTNISNTHQHEYAFPEVGFTTTPQVVSSSISDYNIDNTLSLERDVIVDRVLHVSTENDGADVNECDISYKMDVVNNTKGGGDTTHIHVLHDKSTEHTDIKFEGDHDLVASSMVELPSQVSFSSTNSSFDTDACVLKNSNDIDVGEIRHQVSGTDTHVDIAFNPVGDNTAKVDESDSTNTFDDHKISPGDLQKISSYSSLEAGLIINKTLDALHNSTTKAHVSHEYHVTSNEDNETLPSETDNCIGNLNGFSEHEAEVVLVKTFEELSNESFLRSATSTVEHDIRMKNNSRILSHESNESTQRLTAFSDIEADAVIDKTFEDLSREAANISPESVEYDNPEKAYDILSIDTNIPDKVTTHATSEDNFAHLSLSLDGATNMSANEDIGIFPGVSSETVCKISSFSEHEADVIMNRTFKALSNDASQSTCVDSVLPTESKTSSEITYHILSFEDGPSNDDDLTTGVKGQLYSFNNEACEHLPHGYNSTANKSKEILSKEVDLETKETDCFSSGKVEIIDKGLTDRSSEQSVTKTSALHNELSMSEKTFDIYSLDDSVDRDTNVTTVKMPDSIVIETFEDLSHETNALNESSHKNKGDASCECDHETYNELKVDSVVDKTFDVIGEEPTSSDVTIETNLSEKTYDILSLANDLDEESDVRVCERPSSNEVFEHVSDNNVIDMNVQMSVNTDSFLAIDDHEDHVVTKEKCTNVADVSGYVDLPTENIKVDKDIDVALTEKTCAEVTDVYDTTKSIEVDVKDDTVIDNNDVQHNIIYQNMEGNALDISNSGTVDISVEANKSSIGLVTDNISDNGSSDVGTHSKEEQPKVLTVEKPSISSIDSSKVITIQHKTNELNEHHITSNVMSNGKQSGSPKRPVLQKDKHVNESDLFGDPLDDYVVVDYNEVNYINKSNNQPKFSFSTWSHKLKRVFALSGESNNKETCENTKLRVHVEESRKISSEGEEVQVLTFHRTAVKSDGPASIDFKDGQEGACEGYYDQDGNLEGGTYNQVVVDSSGNLIEKEPGSDNGPLNADASSIDVKAKIKSLEANSKNEEITSAYGRKGAIKKKIPSVSMMPFGSLTANLVNMSAISTTPPDLKLTGKTLTLEKNALLTDRYPTALPGYPSDRRSLIALEIYTTERTFVRGLEIVVKIFQIKIEGSNLLDTKESYSVFSNIEDILATNRDLLDDIFERMSSWSDEQCIGDLFLKCTDKFNMFAEYCKNYDTGEDIIRQKKKKKDFEALLQECYNNPKCMPGQTLSSYLITVIQRFPRYIMLLKDLIKRTPESHPDSQNLKDALKMMEEKTAHINEQLKQSQCQKALEALQTTITGLSQFESPERNLVHEGPVALLTGKKTYQCVLFNDIIVFAHKGENKQSVVDIVLELKSVWVEDLDKMCPQTANEDSIGIYTPDRPYRMYVGSTGEKKIWMRKIKEALIAHNFGGGLSGEDLESEMRTTHYNYKNGTLYEGSFINTKRHGFGKMSIPNLMTYEGEWEDDERNGSGIAKFCTGEVYEGTWKDDKPDGLGTFKYTTGDEISCDWKEGLKVGPCTINFKNGDRFTGECVDGQIQGYGELICIDGLHYSGNWLKNMKHGNGQLTLHDGTEYSGNFVRDKFHGSGELIYPDGSYYKGEFEHGVRCGEGNFTDTGDNTYDGKWIDDKKNGRGTMTYENGDVYAGTWLMDVRQGQGKMTYEHGGYYKGGWECDLMHGSGAMELRNGDIYDGEFNNDMVSGSGTMKYKDGSRFVGEWRNGLPNGRGILTKPGGWSCDGVWLEGKQNGHCTLKDSQNEYEYDGDWLNGIKEGEGTEIRQGFTYTGAFLEDLYHGPGKEVGPRSSKYEGNWHRGMKHGKGTLKHANGLIENQTWKHGYLIESPLIHIPRERTPIQRWIHT